MSNWASALDQEQSPMLLLFLKNMQCTEQRKAATWKPDIVCSDRASMKAEKPCVGAYSPISIVSMDAAKRDMGGRVFTANSIFSGCLRIQKQLD